MKKIIQIFLIVTCFFIGCPAGYSADAAPEKIMISTVDLEVGYEVLGEISVKKKNFLFPIPVKRMNDLLRRKARQMYADADAIIKVQHDRIVVVQGILDKEIGKTAKGIVVKFLKSRELISSGGKLDCEYEKMIIEGESAKNGIFDPSLEYDKAENTGWMAYSAIEEPGLVHTHIARSTDRGRNWIKIAEVNLSCPGIINLPDNKIVEGVWRHEVPTLVHDPDDTGKEWKLFWHKYFVKPPFRGEDRMFVYGWIAYKYAASPEGPWSEETALFGADMFPPAPYRVAVDLNSLHPDLNGAIVYTEPASIYKNGIIYLVLQCQKRNSSKLILLASEDHANSWVYISTLLSSKDAQAFGYQDFVAPSLAQENNRIFLLISPHSPLPVDHDGTVIIEFEDITRGLLKRDDHGQVLIYKHLPATLRGDYVNAGESDYDECNTYGGIVMPQIDLKKAIVKKDLKFLDFQIFNTRQKIINIE